MPSDDQADATDADEPAPDAPEFGFNPLAMVKQIREIKADVAMLKAAFDQLKPAVDEMAAAWGKAAPAVAQALATLRSIKFPV